MKLILSLMILINGVAFSQSYPLMRVLQKDLPGNMVGPFAACGLGSYLFPDYSWISTAPASSTNVSSSTSAPTSTTMNTSECKGPKTLVENQPAIFNYANENFDLIAQDMSNGDGETLDALAELMEIPALERDNWKQVLKADFALIFPAPQVATAYVLDQIANSTARANINSPKTKNLSWREIVFGTY